jgi:signal transduction histidine kinase
MGQRRYASITSHNWADTVGTLDRKMDQPIAKTKSERIDGQAGAVQTLLEKDAELLLENMQRLAGIGTLTAGVSQELANLLSIITTASISLRHELQLLDSSSDDTVQHLLNLIERNSFRCAQIVSMLQKYGSLQAPQMAVTDLDIILRDVLMLVERQFRDESNVRISVNAPGEAPSIVCDHDRIVQLLVNVLMNARDAMKETGGLIEVEVQTLDELDSAVMPEGDDRWLSGRGFVAITVSDEGPGISRAMQQQVFYPFCSAGPGSSGIGLGLSIARQIVDRHHGLIWFSNNNGPARGASVSILLPLRPD